MADCRPLIALYGKYLMTYRRTTVPPRKHTKSAEQEDSSSRSAPSLSLKSGGYLLSRLVDSTIGAIGLNCSVRNGKRWNPDAITT